MPHLFLVFIIIIVFPHYAFAKSACSTAKNSMDELACAHEKYDAATQDLNTAYEGIQTQQDADALETLRQAQQNWLTYRDQECAWEAKAGIQSSLGRLEEVKCLTRMTLNRADFLDMLLEQENISTSKDEALVDSPRWLNTLSDEHHEIFWQYSRRTYADLNCNGRDEVILNGVEMAQDGLIHVLGLSENPQTGRPRNAIFRFSNGKDDEDGQGKNTPCIGQDFSYIAVLHVPAETKEGETNQECSAHINIDVGICGTYSVSWDGKAYQMGIQPAKDITADSATPSKSEH